MYLDCKILNKITIKESTVSIRLMKQLDDYCELKISSDEHRIMFITETNAEKQHQAEPQI